MSGLMTPPRYTEYTLMLFFLSYFYPLNLGWCDATSPLCLKTIERLALMHMRMFLTCILGTDPKLYLVSRPPHKYTYCTYVF